MHIVNCIILKQDYNMARHKKIGKLFPAIKKKQVVVMERQTKYIFAKHMYEHK